MRKLNQKGFSLIEGLLVIIALALIIFVGYYVWHTQKDTNKQLDQANSASQKASSDTKSSKIKQDIPSDANLQVFLIKTCGSSNGAAINAMFANKASQTTETDNYSIEGSYAVSNVQCDLASGVQLTTEFLKYSDGWNLVVDQPTSVSCTFLTNAGFPDKLKAPYCSNGAGGEGNFNT